ncbi:AAA family ATPase [Laspinema sp. A4]|uniref:AAA family ATPase n=1 Tax=Laspinema sp. D2d TaxID=2953686 RepID=UPI0021BB1AD9|nr:AAA family ATPase [Laspinema sp. D2d]MCT7981981.1 AAA family ATPase [Laspinema sp. D2d]
MISIPGYQIVEQLYQTIETWVYRADSEVDQERVILKVLGPEYPSPRELAQFNHEYHLAHGLNCPHLVEYRRLEKHQNRLIIVQQDFGGNNALEVIMQRGLSLIDRLKVAIQIAQGIEELHELSIIHKDIKPQNIIVNLETGQVKITDFSIASRLSKETQGIANLGQLEGTLAYMSPEQTGRMNRRLDYRTDFYSLGVTLYQLLTDCLPFECTDPMEWVHAHLAKLPLPPREVNPEIPLVLSDLIFKLLEKMAERRYQSASGIKADLESCLSQLEQRGTITPFVLGSQDVVNRFQIPQHLYGRDREIDALLNAFERVSQGGKELVMVSGYSGLGKSALVAEVHKPIVRSQGYFIAGKFDLFQRNIPYAAFLQGFSDLMRQLLTESEEILRQWQEKLQTIIGSNLRVIIDVIPELEAIVGPQTLVVSLPPTEAQNRFNLVFKQLIEVFCHEEHPLVLFIDDWQWADTASLNLLKELMSHSDQEYFLVIGAYRDNEVNLGHPLRLTLDDIESTGTRINSIVLEPLTGEAIAQLIGDTLQSDPDPVQPLAELVLEKTNGNPFFVNQLLQSLYDEGKLEFNKQIRAWQWQIEDIKSAQISANVVDLMVKKIYNLDPTGQELIQLAACIGSRFNLTLLSWVYEKSLAETAADLFGVIQEGLIVPQSEIYQWLVSDRNFDPSTSLNIECKFLHDRVLEAAHTLISEERQQEIHLKIGQLLLEHIPSRERDEHLFEIVNHLNISQPLIRGRQEGLQLIELNLQAGQKAKGAAAYETALKYFTTAKRLLPEPCWDSHYHLTLEIYKNQAECQYFLTQFEQAEVNFQEILNNANNVLDRAAIYNIQVIIYTNLGQNFNAIKVGMHGLSMLGISLPDSDLEIKKMLNREQEKIKNYCQKNLIKNLIHQPELNSEKSKAILTLMSNLCSPIIQSSPNPNLFPLIVLTSTNLAIEFGKSDISAFVYSAYGVVLIAAFNEIQTGYEFGQLALEMIEGYNSPYKHKIYNNVGAYINNWSKPLNTSLTLLEKAYFLGIQFGEIVFTTFTALHLAVIYFIQGISLTEYESKIINYISFVGKNNYRIFEDLLVFYQQMARALQGLTQDLTSLSDSQFNEQTFQQNSSKSVTRSGRHIWGVNLSQIFYLDGQYLEAKEHLTEASKYIDSHAGLLLIFEHKFWECLTLLKLHTTLNLSERESNWSSINQNHQELKHWAENCPENFLHKFLLVSAEMARISGNDWEAVELYDRAIESAHEQELLPIEALANELAAQFYLGKGKAKLAKPYLIDARYAYQKWGAIAKVNQLEKAYPDLLSNLVKPPTDGITTIGSIDKISTSNTTTQVLDVSTVIKSYQAISSEINLDRLLAQLLYLAIENAGAQKGVLVLSSNNQLKIEAAKLSDGEVQILESLALENNPLIPASIIQYVSRTQETVILADACHQGIFIHEPYIEEQQTQSILCTPIINQGKLSGVIYLENNLATGAFTPERIELLQVISSQAAISLENAQLYRNLEDKVIERTAQLASANEEISALNERLESDNLRMSAELDITRQLQQKMLPRPEELQQISNLEIAGFMEPADEVGGDYYDVLNYDGRIKIGIGDVTGHGLESGMVMVMVQTAVRTLLANNETDYIKFLSTINRTIYDNVERMNSDKNLTLVLLDYADGVLQISGQHEEIIIVRAHGEIERIDTLDLGFPIGLVTEIADFITQAEVKLNPGDGVVLYTDGITEASNMAREQYGLERLCDVVSQNWQYSAEEVRKIVIENLREFIEDQKIFDDITLVVLKQK